MTSPSSLSCVILCAGGSSRMGTPKGLLELGDRAILLEHIDLFSRVSAKVMVVLGAHHERYIAILPAHVQVVLNPNWQTTGPIESLQCALRTFKRPHACLVTPVDTCPTSESLLRRLLAQPFSCVPITPDGQRGHPAFLDASTAHALKHSTPREGLRTLLRHGPTVQARCPLIPLDFDTPESFEMVKRRYRAKIARFN